MAAFEKLDWTRFDVHALGNGRGIGVIDAARADECRAWLQREGYVVERWSFEDGVGPAVAHLGRRLRWEEQFGYPLSPDSRNLDALRDGFLSDEWRSDALVLEVHQAEAAWRAEPDWFLGVLAIAQERSLWELALGRRFFVVLVLERTSPLIGQTVESSRVPAVF
ncbi:MAG TPA: hypothetical protein VEB43_09255 [Anaeromyxobacter sp.]|nr:hypothetical protein [Anaeromyxobacter sp.]